MIAGLATVYRIPVYECGVTWYFMIGAIITFFGRLACQPNLAEVESRYFVPGVNEGEVALTEKRLELVRGLGAWASAAIVVRHMIGTGIFLKPPKWLAKAAASPWYSPRDHRRNSFHLRRVLFAELGSMIPEAGGEYAYLRRGFGPVYGFLFGWMHSIRWPPEFPRLHRRGHDALLSFLLPTIALPLFTVHIAIPASLAGSNRTILSSPGRNSRGRLAADYDRRELSRRAARRRGPNFLDHHQITSVAIVIGVAFFAPASTQASGSQPFGRMQEWALAPSSALFCRASGGTVGLRWLEDLNLVGSEVENPQKNFPRALVGGVGFVAVVYSALQRRLFESVAH